MLYVYAGSGGIGGGAIVEGLQLRGAAGYGGEFGHARIDGGNSKDYAGLSGTLESLLRRDDLLEAFKMFSATDEELEAEILSTNVARNRKLIESQIDVLGIGLGSFVTIFNPEAVVLGGYLGALVKFDPDRLLQRLRENSLSASSERVVVLEGELRRDLLMIGAAELPFAPLLESPSEFLLTKSQKSRRTI